MKITAYMIFSILIQYAVFGQLPGNSQELSIEKKPKYPVASGIIIYEVTGDADGMSALHFDRNGWRSSFLEEITLKRYGTTSTEKTIKLTDGDFVYLINPGSGKVKKEINRNWSSLISYKKQQEVIAAILQNEGGEITGEDTLLNKPCRVWTFENGTRSRLWEYQGIPLKIEKKLPGFTYTIEATSIKLDVNPDERVFLPPDSIQWD